MNSLTVNNRVPQLRGTPSHGFPPFWYGSMVSGSDASCNHRNAGSTVGETCICLTAGSGTGEGDMSTLFAGSRKPSALSTCEKSIPRSVLARCGNLRESSLSVKRQQCINPQNAARQTRKSSAPKGAVINQAAESLIRSRCISSNGMMTPLSTRSTTPTSISPRMSECTALKSRPTRRATSRMVISPAPAIASTICIRLGESFFQSNSALGKEMVSPMYSVDENPVSINSLATRKESLRSTLMVNVRMMLPPAMIQYVSLKIFTQLTDTGECRDDFLTANVLVIAFSGFIVVTNDAYIVLDVSQTVLVFVLACPDGRINKPDNDFDETPVREIPFIFGDKFCAHDGEYYITLLVMSKTPSLDYLIFGSYTVSAPHKTGVGCRNPEHIRAHNRAFAVFLCVKHGHIRIMVGRAGQPQGWPGSRVTGIPTPVRLAT